MKPDKEKHMGARKQKPHTEAPATQGVVNTNLATSVPETGTVYAGYYLNYSVQYRVDAVGRKIIISPENLRGVVMP